MSADPTRPPLPRGPRHRGPRPAEYNRAPRWPRCHDYLLWPPVEGLDRERWAVHRLVIEYWSVLWLGFASLEPEFPHFDMEGEEEDFDIGWPELVEEDSDCSCQ